VDDGVEFAAYQLLADEGLGIGHLRERADTVGIAADDGDFGAGQRLPSIMGPSRGRHPTTSSPVDGAPASPCGAARAAGYSRGHHQSDWGAMIR